jgi:hypothetical protein
MSRRPWFVSSAVLVAVLGAGAARAATTLPENEHLDTVRPALQALVDRADKAGVPSDLIVSKVREGLAKGVPPETIRIVAEQLARELGDANDFLRAHRKTDTTARLVRAVAEARAAGVQLAALAPLVESHAREPQVARGLEAVTDLGLRGYPGPRAAFVVAQVLERDPEAVGQVVASVESIRRAQAISRADALDALSKHMSSAGGSLQSAVSRSLEGNEHSANGNGKNGQGNERGGGVAGDKKNMGNGMGMKNK